MSLPHKKMASHKKKASPKTRAKLQDLNPKRNPKGGAFNTYLPRITAEGKIMLNPQPLPP